jgi:hypothetical protein
MGDGKANERKATQWLQERLNKYPENKILLRKSDF